MLKSSSQNDRLSTTVLYAVLAGSGIAISLLILRLGRARRRASYPPGPKPRLLIGNLLDIPKEFEHIHFKEMSSQYGELHLIVYVYGRTEYTPSY